MILYRDNKVQFELPDEEVLYRFAGSEVRRNKQLDEEVRFALFLAYDEPAGLQSTSVKEEFNRVWDLWTENKFIYTTKIAAERKSNGKLNSCSSYSSGSDRNSVL